MAGLHRTCSKCSKTIPTVGVKVGPASPAAARLRKGRFAGRWICWACAEVEKARGQVVETLYVADAKGKHLLPEAAKPPAGKPVKTQAPAKEPSKAPATPEGAAEATA